jgi:hypothetical protein
MACRWWSGGGGGIWSSCQVVTGLMLSPPTLPRVLLCKGNPCKRMPFNAVVDFDLSKGPFDFHNHAAHYRFIAYVLTVNQNPY